MGNKSSKETTIRIDGFGGLSIGFPDKLTPPLNIVGTYIDNPNKVKLPNNSSPTDKTIVEVATLTTTTQQEITIESKKYTFGVGTYYINKTYDGNYILMNDPEDSLSKLIVPVKTGGRRKRQTKGRKAKKHSRRRRSVRA